MKFNIFFFKHQKIPAHLVIKSMGALEPALMFMGMVKYWRTDQIAIWDQFTLGMTKVV
jgi:hypothetical protein